MHSSLKKFGNWYNRKGYRFLNIEVIGIIILIAIFVWFLRKQPKGKYKFLGISGKDIKFKKPRKGPSSHSKKEEKCRNILERIYFKPFPSARPNFLKNPATGKNLEIDCYNKSLKIGLEYDGKQHAEYNPFFHRKGPIEFTYQVKKDEWKNEKCKKEGICLIRVPHWIPDIDLENFIRNKLRKAGKL